MTDCWVWHGGHSPEGYSRLGSEYVHRVLYEEVKGPIPAGAELDHLCRNVWCVNPHHLEPVTHAENIFRGDCNNRRKTHCPKGHPYDERNTKTVSRKTLGGAARRCRACLKEQRHARYLRLGR